MFLFKKINRIRPISKPHFSLLATMAAIFTADTGSAQTCSGIPDPPVWSGPGSIVEAPLPVDSELGDTSVAEWPSVGIEGCNGFMVAWRLRPMFDESSQRLAVQRYSPDGVLSGSFELLTVTTGLFGTPQLFESPSIAVSPAGTVRAGWIGRCNDCLPPIGSHVLYSDFDFNASPTAIGVMSAPPMKSDAEPSVGANDFGGRRITWYNVGPDGPTGLFQGISPALASTIRSCNSECFPQWKPCMAMRPNGDYIVAWAEAEQPSNPNSPFNIALRVYDATGALVDEIAGLDPLGIDWVNDVASEPADSQQVSPAVSFDEDGRIVVTWVGPVPFECNHPAPGIFARRFQWNGGPSDEVTAVSSVFRIDTPSLGSAINDDEANPTVSLIQYSDLASFPSSYAGRFIIAWNTEVPGIPNRREIHAVYFDSNGSPMGGEFRATLADGPSAPNGEIVRRLGGSSQHTVVYGRAGQVVLGWTGSALVGPIHHEPHVTLLPVGHAEFQASLAPCLKGDVDNNGFVNGLDIQPFIDLLLASQACMTIIELCPADMNNDATVSVDDIPCFVATLLTGSYTCEFPGGKEITDCNENQRDDLQDILLGSSQDINGNFTPDECEIDCNHNGIPDDYDVVTGFSEDCDGSGFPDECEADCNDNGIHDDCDVDPLDPDGDGIVSPDCNVNGVPDSCDVLIPPPFGSADTNMNGIPDECEA